MKMFVQNTQLQQTAGLMRHRDCDVKVVDKSKLK